MKYILYCTFFTILPSFFYIIYYVKKTFHKYITFFFFLNIFLFFFFIIVIYFFFFIFFSLFFFFNTWRYLKFFKRLGHSIYFKKLSIYFSFWQYIILYINKNIYNIIIYIFIYFYNIIIYLFNIYFLRIIIINFFIPLKTYMLYIFFNLYNYFIIFKKLLFNLKFMEIFYYFSSFFFNKKKDLNNKYLDDPFIFRNKFIKLYTNINYYINIIINTNYYIKQKKYIFFFFIYILDKYIKIFIYKICNIKISLYLIKNIYNNNIEILFIIIYKYIIIVLLYVYIFLLNIIYNLIKINIYILFYFFKFIILFIKRNFFFIKCIILLLFLFYFYWIINYFFLLLYKHYFLYIPLFNIKENLHFINFDWIDLRNYFNIIKLHNTLIDLNIHNNFFYSEIIKQLNLKLNKYNFKFSSNFNINLFIENNFNKTKMNKETIILNNIFEKWNKYHGAHFIRRWKKYKRMLNWSLRHMFKGRDWYKAVKKEKLKGCQLPIFNNSRYFENSKTEISNNMGFWENLNQVKRLPYNKDLKTQFQKTQAWYTYFKKRHTSKKKPRYLLSSYIRLKNIPFSYIYKEFNIFFLEKYKLKKVKEINWAFESYFNKIKKVEKVIFTLKNLFIDLKYLKLKKQNNRLFFFKKYYRNFINEQQNFIWKNKIPTLLITEMRTQRVPPNTFTDKSINDYVSMSHTDEMNQYVYYRDLSKKSCLKNVIFKIRYIYKKYPYRINKKKMYYQYIIKNYFNLTHTSIKILKKFYFFDRNKLRNFNKLSHRLLNKIDTVYSNQLLKYKYWERVFFLKRLNEKNLDFWGFFDYLKVNRYKTLKNNNYFSVFFIEHWKKDYYHMRIYLLRIVSFLHYYNLYKKVKMDNNFKFLSWLKNVKVEGKPLNLETLSTLNSFTFINNVEKVNDNIMEQNKEQEQINEDLFHHFKLRWHFKELLHASGVDSFGNKDKFMYMMNLFYKKFNKYFIEYNKINKYNNKYKFKIKSYKIKVLRKIKNLKKFFFQNTKRNKGLRIFSYLNTFSIQFHIKHLLWHSPYSFLKIKKNNIFKNQTINRTFFYYYTYQKQKYDINYYSYVFNLFLNILDIKEEWAYYLTDNKIHLLNKNALKFTFYYSYYYGNFFFFYLNELDIFRIFIILLKNYYNNFLIKLTKYRYYSELKDYNIIKILKRFLKNWYNSLYLKVRYFIYQTHETYVRYVKRKYLRFIRKKYWIRNRVDLIPFWFIFDYYIKCLIKYLFSKYFIKEHFIFWWLCYRLNFSFSFFFWLNIQKYKYSKIIYLNNFYFWIFIKHLIFNMKYYYNFLIKQNILIFLWYKNILMNNYIYFVFKEYNLNLLIFLYKNIFFNYYFYIKILIINILNYILNLKYLLLFKFNIQDISNFFIKFLQNIKNKVIFFKSNYFYFKKQKLIRRRKRRIPLISLLSTNLKRNWFFLKNRSSNFFVYHNIYLLNLKTIFLIKYDINLYNFFLIITNTFPFIKKKLLKYNIYICMVYVIYIIFFIMIFFINKKYFKIFFINKKYHILDFDFKIKINKNENKFNFINNLNKKNLYIYKFFLFKSLRNLNLIKIFYNQKFIWFKKFLNLKKFLNHNSFDQFNKNKPIYKSILFTITFININNLEKFINNYKKFFIIKKMPLINLFNDYLMFYRFNFKKEGFLFNYQKLTDNINFNYIIFYWMIIIPYFFFQYILIKYHLKLYIKTKRRIFYFFRTILDNIRLFVKINKYMGRSFFKSIYKSKRWKDPSHVFLSKKRPKRSHFSTNNLRYRKLYYRLSPIGSYYFWFSKINLIQYLLSYKNFFFNTIIKSYYYFWFIIIYLLILIYLLNKHFNIIILKKFNLYFFKKKSI